MIYSSFEEWVQRVESSKYVVPGETVFYHEPGDGVVYAAISFLPMGAFLGEYHQAEQRGWVASDIKGTD